MSDQSFKVKNGLTVTPVIPTSVTNPTDGDIICDSTDSNKLKTYSSSTATWVDVGSGASSSASGTNDVVEWATNGKLEDNLTGFFNYAGTAYGSITAATDIITNPAHKLENGNTISFTSITTTTGISINTTYYVVGATTNTFQVSSTFNGTAINLVNDGSCIYVTHKPQDIFSGSASFTYAVDTVDPLQGTKSLKITHGAANRMGQGIYYNFTVNKADTSRMLRVSLDYIQSGATAMGTGNGSTLPSDVTVWVYDYFNAKFIQPTSFQLDESSQVVPSTFSGYFQTSTGLNYALILHMATPTTTDWSILVDNISITRAKGASSSMVGPMSNPKAITIGATTTAPTKGTTAIDSVRWRQVGEYAEIEYRYRQTGTGSAGSGEYLFSLPDGLTMDSSQPVSTTSASGGSSVDIQPTVIGYGHISNGSARGQCTCIAYNTTQFRVIDAVVFSSYDSMSSGNYALSTSTLAFSFIIRVKIVGWQATVKVSDGYDGRVVVASATSTTAIGTSDTQLALTKVEDSVSGLTSNSYIVQTPGYYNLKLNLNGTSGSTGVDWTASIKVNGTVVASSINSQAYYTSTIAEIPKWLNTNDVVTFFGKNNILASATNNGSVASVTKVAGSPLITPGVTIAASYYLPANFATSVTIPINFSGLEYDYTGAVTTSATAWMFKAQTPGLYEITGVLLGNTSHRVMLYKNGTIYKHIGDQTGSLGVTISTAIKLNADEYIDIRPDQAVTYTGGNLNSTSGTNICIKKVG